MQYLKPWFLFSKMNINRIFCVNDPYYFVQSNSSFNLDYYQIVIYIT